MSEEPVDPVARRRVKARTAAFILLINAVLVILLLAGAELVLSAFAVPAAVRFSVYPPSQVVTVKVDPSVTPGVSGDAVYEVNALGTRGPLPKSDDEVRILAIGGSTTECFVLSLQESWPFLLGRSLEEKTGRRVWVGNIGRAGRASRQHYFDARYVAPQFGRVDFAILLVGVNDLFNRMIQGKEFEPADVVELDAGGTYIKTALQISENRESRIGRLQLVKRGRRLLESLSLLSPREREIQRLLSHTLPDYYLWSREQRAARGETIDSLPPMAAPLAEFERNVALTVKALREIGTASVLVTQPSIWRADIPEEEERLLWLGSADGWPPRRSGGPYYSTRAMAEMLEMYNASLRRVAASESAELVDLAKLVPADLTTFYDDIHFNESGAKRVAEAISDYFLLRHLVAGR